MDLYKDADGEGGTLTSIPAPSPEILIMWETEGANDVHVFLQTTLCHFFARWLKII